MASSSIGKASAWSDSTNWLSASSTINTGLAASPAGYTLLVPNRAVRRPPRSAATIAAATCGMNRTPQLLGERIYPLVAVKIALAAGRVTSTIPCTRPVA